jgi:hypothetical protein
MLALARHVSFRHSAFCWAIQLHDLNGSCEFFPLFLES